MCKYNAESPKQGSKRFNYIVKTINIVNLSIIYLCFQVFNYRYFFNESVPVRFMHLGHLYSLTLNYCTINSDINAVLYIVFETILFIAYKCLLTYMDPCWVINFQKLKQMFFVKWQDVFKTKKPNRVSPNFPKRNSVTYSANYCNEHILKVNEER